MPITCRSTVFFEFNLTSSELNYRYKFFALFQIHCFRKQLCHLFVHRYGIVEFNVPLQLVCAVSFERYLFVQYLSFLSTDFNDCFSSFPRPTRSHAHRCSRLTRQHGDDLVTLTLKVVSFQSITCTGTDNLTRTTKRQNTQIT